MGLTLIEPAYILFHFVAHVSVPLCSLYVFLERPPSLPREMKLCEIFLFPSRFPFPSLHQDINPVYPWYHKQTRGRQYMRLGVSPSRHNHSQTITSSSFALSMPRGEVGRRVRSDFLQRLVLGGKLGRLWHQWRHTTGVIGGGWVYGLPQSTGVHFFPMRDCYFS